MPVYNEEELIPLLQRTVSNVMNELGEDWEVVYVNDGSKDSSLQLLRAEQAQDSHVVVVDLSRNWGHMGALSAGLRSARGDAIVLMDSDLQDPPEVIPEFVEAWRNGAQVVTGVRRSREERRKALALLFPLFYRVLGALSDFPIPLNAGIFGLLDRQAVDAINSLREGNRYLPGLRAWVGYRTAVVLYDRHDRAAGDGKLSFMSRIRYAMDAITSFSYKPLRLSFLLTGLGMFAASVAGTASLFSRNLMNHSEYGIVASIFLTGSMLLFCIGILGEYIGRVYDEVRDRPLSIISEVYSPAQVSEQYLAAKEYAKDISSERVRIMPAA